MKTDLSTEELLRAAQIAAEDLAINLGDHCREIEKLQKEANVLLLRVQLAAFKHTEDLRNREKERVSA